MRKARTALQYAQLGIFTVRLIRPKGYPYNSNFPTVSVIGAKVRGKGNTKGNGNKQGKKRLWCF